MIPIQNETNTGNAIEDELYSKRNQRNHQIESNRNRVENDSNRIRHRNRHRYRHRRRFRTQIKKIETIDFQTEIHCYRHTNPIVICNKTNQTIKWDRIEIQ